jgi:hypothetical protein
MNIHKANNDFDFKSLELSPPVNTAGNSYFTSLNIKGKPIYIETPPVTTKQGFVKNAKKVVCDLMFASDKTEFIQWFESLESTCHKLVYEKSDQWFQNSLEFDDIENAFSPSLKTFKSGKYHLCRCNIGLDYNTGSPITKVYNENEMLVSYEEVTDQTQLISIMEIRGIKFTSRSFQLDFDLKQVMILNTDNDFDKCLIRKSSGGSAIPNTKQETSGKIGMVLPKYAKGAKKDEVEDDNIDLDDDVTEKDVDDDVINIPTEQESVKENNDVSKKDTPDELSEQNIVLETESIDTVKLDNAVEEKAGNISNEEASFDQVIENMEDKLVPPSLIKPDDVSLKESENIETTKDEEILKTEENVKHEIPSTTTGNGTPVLTDEPSSLFDIGEPIEGLELVEPDLIVPDDTESMTIKNPNQVYQEIYKKAKVKAKQLKQEAIKAIMEANSIKNAYMLDDIDDSDLSDFDEDDDYESGDEEEVDSSAVY